MQQQQQQSSQQAQPQFTFEGGHLVMYHKEATGLTAKDATVNDQDRMTDALNTAKHLTDEYNIAMNEASHDALYQVLKQNNDSVHQLERQLFNIMFKKGWYKLPVADAQSVAQAHTKFQQYKQQYPFPQKAQGASQSQSQVQTQIQAQTQIQTPSGSQMRTAQVSVKASPSSTQASAKENTSMQTAGGQSVQASSNQSYQMQAGGSQASSAQAGGTNANQAVQQAVSQVIKDAEQGRIATH